MTDSINATGALVTTAVDTIMACQREGTLTANKLSFMLGTLTSETRRLALEEAKAGLLPTKCEDCEEPLFKKLQSRCPTHIAMTLAKDTAKAKAREHGPAIVGKAVAGLHGLFEKYLAEDQPEAQASPPTDAAPSADDFKTPPS